MIYGYIRVSTDKQECENQKIGIERKATSLGLNVDRYIEDAGVSGTKEPDIQLKIHYFLQCNLFPLSWKQRQHNLA